jgi:DNA-binding CsgD family transcriptional regulator
MHYSLLLMFSNFVREEIFVNVRPELTTKELEALRLFADGKEPAEIRVIMSIGDVMMKKHRKNIFDKFGVQNVVGAVLEAMCWGILPLPELYKFEMTARDAAQAVRTHVVTSPKLPEAAQPAN